VSKEAVVNWLQSVVTHCRTHGVTKMKLQRFEINTHIVTGKNQPTA